MNRALMSHLIHGAAESARPWLTGQITCRAVFPAVAAAATVGQMPSRLPGEVLVARDAPQADMYRSYK
jgi:hypothetical protein